MVGSSCARRAQQRSSRRSRSWKFGPFPAGIRPESTKNRFLAGQRTKLSTASRGASPESREERKGGEEDAAERKRWSLALAGKGKEMEMARGRRGVGAARFLGAKGGEGRRATSAVGPACQGWKFREGPGIEWLGRPREGRAHLRPLRIFYVLTPLFSLLR